MWLTRYYILKDSTLLCYKDRGSKAPSSKLYLFFKFVFIDVIYLNGLYVEPYFTKGIKGFRIFHDSEYFKEKVFYHKDQKLIDIWINKVKLQAAYYDINKKYQKMQ